MTDSACSGNRKLELILDVPVKSRVVLGVTKRKLKDLLSIKPGMIIETEHSVAEDVRLYVNDNLVALGEVVVAGENYGLRISKIVSPLERVKKLNQLARD